MSKLRLTTEADRPFPFYWVERIYEAGPKINPSDHPHVTLARLAYAVVQPTAEMKISTNRQSNTLTAEPAGDFGGSWSSHIILDDWLSTIDNLLAQDGGFSSTVAHCGFIAGVLGLSGMAGAVGDPGETAVDVYKRWIREPLDLQLDDFLMEVGVRGRYAGQPYRPSGNEAAQLDAALTALETRQR